MWRRVALVRTDISEERIASISRVLLVTANVVPSLPILSSLLMKATRSSEMSVPTWATRRHIPEDGFLHSHWGENLKSYTNSFASVFSQLLQYSNAACSPVARLTRVLILARHLS
jgi:hypothetical protein